jgi:hypothetical protein
MLGVSMVAVRLIELLLLRRLPAAALVGFASGLVAERRLSIEGTAACAEMIPFRHAASTQVLSSAESRDRASPKTFAKWFLHACG